jgi:quinol monooxygenase YgiN
MSTLILDGFILVPQSELELVQEALLIHTVLTQNEPGCIVFKVDQCLNDRCKFYVHEEFDSEESFHRHQSRAHASRWGEVTKGVQRHYTVTRV